MRMKIWMRRLSVLAVMAAFLCANASIQAESMDWESYGEDASYEDSEEEWYVYGETGQDAVYDDTYEGTDDAYDGIDDDAYDEDGSGEGWSGPAGTPAGTAAGSPAGNSAGNTLRTGSGALQSGTAGQTSGTGAQAAGTNQNQDVLVMLEGITPTCQYPELPTGCEMTSLAIALNYFGLSVDKCDLADRYLDKKPVGEADFYQFFVGDPRDESSFGCYAPVVVNAANRYLDQAGSEMEAYDYTGSELKDLFPFLDAGVPVIIWATLDLAEGSYTVTWNIDGKDLTWFSPEHCMVLVGYGQKTVWVADPVYGKIRDFPMELFESRYQDLHQQAVILQ